MVDTSDTTAGSSGLLDVNFKLLRAGQTFQVEFVGRPGIGVIIGDSGSGKTTAFECIAGLVTPTSGHIKLGQKVFFESTTGVTLPPQHRRIGYVLQRPTLFPHMTVRENVKYGIKGASKVSIEERIESLSNEFGIKHFLDKRPQAISGGQSQRVAIVRAIASEPELFLLDEPFSNLDERARGEMLTAVKNLLRVTGKPILYITHSPREAEELADYRITGAGGIFRLE